MKKIVLFCLLIGGIWATSSAQVLMFGPRVSLTSGEFKANELLSDDESLLVKWTDSRSTVQGGVFARLTLLGLYVQPELMLSTARLEYEVTDNQTGNTQTDLSERFYFVDIPLVGGTRLGPFRVQGGPVYRMRFNSASDLTSLNEVQRQFDNRQIDLRAGLGVDLGPLILDLNAQFPLQRSQDYFTVNGTPLRLNNRSTQLIASLGFKL